MAEALMLPLYVRHKMFITAIRDAGDIATLILPLPPAILPTRYGQWLLNTRAMMRQRALRCYMLDAADAAAYDDAILSPSRYVC